MSNPIDVGEFSGQHVEGGNGQRPEAPESPPLKVPVTNDDLSSPANLQSWLARHLDQDHSCLCSGAWSMADLKAAHDQIHAFLSEPR